MGPPRTSKMEDASQKVAGKEQGGRYLSENDVRCQKVCNCGKSLSSVGIRRDCESVQRPASSVQRPLDSPDLRDGCRSRECAMKAAMPSSSTEAVLRVILNDSFFVTSFLSSTTRSAGRHVVVF